ELRERQELARGVAHQARPNESLRTRALKAARQHEPGKAEKSDDGQVHEGDQAQTEDAERLHGQSNWAKPRIDYQTRQDRGACHEAKDGKDVHAAPMASPS